MANPFTLPSDEEVFKLRDAERKMKKIDREKQSSLRVWEKTTSTAQLSRSTKVSELLGEMGGDVDAGPTAKRSQLAAAAKNMLSGVNEPGSRKPEKENMSEFVAKKREVFLVQMSLDTKREEIRKLEEKASMREEALKRSEQMLEEDAIRFDTFLKENDKKAHDAIKLAERETKLKQDKVGDIKRLNQAIQAVQSDISKHRESLEDCLRFRAFLDGLTPKDHFEEEKHRKAQRQRERRERRVAAALAAWEAAKEAGAAEFEARKEAELGALVEKGVSRKKAAVTVAAMRPPRPPDRPNVEEEPLTSSGAELEMYFTSPRQLVHVFSQLEEQNLFLIQNSQETEQALDGLRAEFTATRGTMLEKTSALQAAIGGLERSIGEEEARAQALRSQVSAIAGDDSMLRELHARVLDVYKRCGFDVSGGSPGTLFMLSELEARLEDLLSAMTGMPEDYVAKAEKAKDKQRRDRKRAELTAEQERIQEERNRKSNERSMMAPNKRTGRPVMYRSRPFGTKAVAEEKEEAGQGDVGDLRFLTDD